MRTHGGAQVGGSRSFPRRRWVLTGIWLATQKVIRRDFGGSSELSMGDGWAGGGVLIKG
jgi:hypothetical protein